MTGVDLRLNITCQRGRVALHHVNDLRLQRERSAIDLVIQAHHYKGVICVFWDLADANVRPTINQHWALEPNSPLALVLWGQYVSDRLSGLNLHRIFLILLDDEANDVRTRRSIFLEESCTLKNCHDRANQL